VNGPHLKKQRKTDMAILHRVSSGILQRRLVITDEGHLKVTLPVLKEESGFDNEVWDMTECKVIADLKNMATLHVRLKSGAAPEVQNIRRAGEPMPPFPKVEEDSSGRKNKFKRAIGLFVMIDGEFSRLERLELCSKEPYIINSFVDLNNGPHNEQLADYENMVPVIEITGPKELTNWAGKQVMEIEWGIYTWTPRHPALPDELSSKENPKEEENEEEESSGDEGPNSIPF
jgi:hypothetical protein